MALLCLNNDGKILKGEEPEGMKNIVFILLLFMALTSLSCSKEDTSPIKSENPLPIGSGATAT